MTSISTDRLREIEIIGKRTRSLSFDALTMQEHMDIVQAAFSAGETSALRASKPEVEKLIEFTGVISKLTPDGVSAVVTLDAEVGGKRLAVINLQTVGRLKLVSSGRYYNGHPVSGTAIRGPDALLAVTIEAASLEGNRDER